MDFSSRLQTLTAQTEAALDTLVPALPADAPAGPARIHAAMRYSLQAGGKRLRPALALAAAGLAGPEAQANALPVAGALECIHTYSLIHDDLPCMDNDDLRRGRPTCHRAFDEATALLAGDALLAQAFLITAEAYANRPALAAALLRELARASSATRLVGGQMQDLLAERAGTATASELDFIHLNKTAALLEASLVCGGLVGSLPDAAITELRRAGRHLGLAFQIIDDVLDATAESTALGKTAGKDARAGKATYVSLHGLEASTRAAAEETTRARAALASLPGDASLLLGLADLMLTRQR
ncbi:polyprenyl synthetase family protein [bacterium]|jgi:geranylgeranyl pyrophosphate synthase|nr:polyprenyl synthetase family protein [bacterium]